MLPGLALQPLGWKLQAKDIKRITGIYMQRTTDSRSRWDSPTHGARHTAVPSANAVWTRAHITTADLPASLHNSLQLRAGPPEVGPRTLLWDEAHFPLQGAAIPPRPAPRHGGSGRAEEGPGRGGGRGGGRAGGGAAGWRVGARGRLPLPLLNEPEKAPPRLLVPGRCRQPAAW